MIYHTEDYSRIKLACRSLLGCESNRLTGNRLPLSSSPAMNPTMASALIVLAPSLKARDEEF